MGKKRIVKKEDAETSEGQAKTGKSPKRKVASGRLCIQATYNNTRVLLTDSKGNSLFSSSSGALGFKGAKKGTPFAAAKAGELVGEQAQAIGVRDVVAIIKGVGAGRESALRGFISKGINILSIQDKTPVPFNGPKAKKPRRV